MSRRRKPVPREPITCFVESLSHEGRGVSHLEGKTQFVDGGLPGETITARYIHRRGKFDELVAEVAPLDNPHPARVQPPCPHAQICGGCSLQHVSAEFQIRHKQQVLLDQLQHFGQLSPPAFAEPLTSHATGYRTKARLGVRYVVKHDEILVGFRERYSNFLSRIDQCPVLIPEVGLRIPELKALIRSLSCYRQIPQIEVAAGDDRCALVFRHMAPLTEEDHGQLIEFSKLTGIDIYLQPKGPNTIHKLWPQDHSDWLRYSLTDPALTLEFHPSDFTQVNREINQKMLFQALSWLDLQPTDKVLDLFCGLGNFTLPVATRAASVVGVEGSETMVERGYHNARLNKIDNVEFFAADLHLPLMRDSGKPWLRSYDKLLLDPPRSGAEEIVKAIGLINVPKIVYVSCNPATLARDAGILLDKGYKLVKAGVMDMFPHTSHVESMAVFVR